MSFEMKTGADVKTITQASGIRNDEKSHASRRSSNFSASHKVTVVQSADQPTAMTPAPATQKSDDSTLSSRAIALNDPETPGVAESCLAHSTRRPRVSKFQQSKANWATRNDRGPGDKQGGRRLLMNQLSGHPLRMAKEAREDPSHVVPSADNSVPSPEGRQPT